MVTCLATLTLASRVLAESGAPIRMHKAELRKYDAALDTVMMLDDPVVDKAVKRAERERLGKAPKKDRVEKKASDKPVKAKLLALVECAVELNPEAEPEEDPAE